MGADTGTLEALRIMRERERDADRVTAQVRDDNILRTEPPLFVDAMAACEEEIVNNFNTTLGLSGDEAVTFIYANGIIEIGKRERPMLLKKAILLHARYRVIVRTQTLSRLYQPSAVEEIWRFDIKRGELTLNGKNLIECADALFVGVADAFR
jgi:hypothetical protein